jgi:flagellar assembly protein FliH
MAGIIKSSGPLRAADGATFNFDDMATKAGQYLEQVRKQAAEILAQAGKDAAALRAKAEQEGRATGQKAIEKMVDERLAQQMTTLMPALKQAVSGIQEAKQAWLRHWERQGVHTATAIAARVIRREVRQAPEITLTLLREALELAAGSHDIQVQLNPADHAALGAQAKQLIQELGRVAGAQVVASPEVTPGGCRVETRFGTIDQQFEAQLARIEQELT